jgi:Flp pilus assembly pilin Flp
MVNLADCHDPVAKQSVCWVMLLRYQVKGKQMAQEFIADESGAVTVDWVVLTAALVGLGLAVMSVISGGLQQQSGDITAELEGDIVSTSFGGPTDTGETITPFAGFLASTVANTEADYLAQFRTTGAYLANEEQVRSDYDAQITTARAAMSPGMSQNSNTAAQALDRALGIANAAEARGITLNDGHESIDTVAADYLDTFPE